MPAAIDTLMEEHRLFERLFGAFDAWTDSIGSRDEAANRESLAYFVSFVRGFADRIHHGKEEDIVFVTLAEQGFPTEDGPIAMMLYEHAQGREMLSAIEAIATLDRVWSSDDRETLVELVEQLDELLRQHIRKEEEILFRMAAERVPPNVMDQITARCDERDRASDEERSRLEALAEKLIATYA
ncbi:MAG: hemerythrin domain-containing protein [Deltaproteobacteria bacterium]|nr:hemerythrin domain-containing protein [Deltaproteobacteria bacterium]